MVKIEPYGIESIPKEERRVGAWDLFVIWAGLNICLPSFLIGALMVPSLSFFTATWVNIVGNIIIGTWIVLMGYAGIKYGIPSMVFCRSVLGHPIGSYIPSIFILISGVGWYAVQAELCGLAVNEVAKAVFGFSSPVLMIVIVGLICSTSATIGYKAIKWLSRIAIPALTFLCVWILWVLTQRYGFTTLINYHPTHEISYGTAIDLVIGGLAEGALLASDYSRYGKNYRAGWIGCMNGVVPVCVFLALVGILSSLATGEWNPVIGVMALGMGIPALFILILSTWTTNDNNLYSTGLAMTNMLPVSNRALNTFLFGIVGTILAAFGIIKYFEVFLSLLAYLFSPLMGIIFCDYFLVKRQEIDIPELYKKKGKYYYWRGINIIAFVALAIGIIVNIITPTCYIRSIVSFVVGGASYLALVKLGEGLKILGRFGEYA